MRVLAYNYRMDGGLFHEGIRATNHDTERYRGMRRMWGQALLVAARDATKETANIDRYEARAFFTRDSYHKDRIFFDMVLRWEIGTVREIGRQLEATDWRKLNLEKAA